MRVAGGMLVIVCAAAVLAGPASVGHGHPRDDATVVTREHRIATTVVDTWAVRGSVTRVVRLRVRGAPAGAEVRVLCRGRGCPFGARRVFAGGRGIARLARLFRGSRLRPGTVVEIHISKPGAVGKSVRYTMRRGRRPRVKQATAGPARAATGPRARGSAPRSARARAVGT